MNEEALLQAGYRYALSLCNDPAEAEDLAQEAWCRLAERERWARVQEKGLLFTTVRNLFIDRYRKARLAVFSSLDSVPEVPDPARPGDLAAIRMDLEGALARLRPEEREAVFLQVVEGYTAAEIATLTGRARGTVLSLIHRAKGKLRRTLSADAEGRAGDSATRREAGP
jgi:RNA polymerase sigma-70 factor (ECF subfamily)